MKPFTTTSSARGVWVLAGGATAILLAAGRASAATDPALTPDAGHAAGTVGKGQGVASVHHRHPHGVLDAAGHTATRHVQHVTHHTGMMHPALRHHLRHHHRMMHPMAAAHHTKG